MGTPEPAHLIPIAIWRVASGSLPLFELAARWGHPSAGGRAVLFPPPRRDHGRSRLVAILATAGRSTLIAAGSTEQTRNLGAHGRPNTAVRSARERRCLDLFLAFNGRRAHQHELGTIRGSRRLGLRDSRDRIEVVT